jgi:cell division protein FtsW (lipid II flippase)
VNIDEYITTLTDQIRCKKARQSVAKEIKDHILDQSEAYEEMGLSHEQAEEKAVKEMGNPVETGIALDRIHRPQMDWRLFLMSVVFSALGLFVLYSAGGLSENMSTFTRQCFYTVAAIFVIGAVYFVDYSFIGKYGLQLYVALTLGLFIFKQFSPIINGRVPALSYFVYFYVPVFAGVLNKFRGEKIVGVLKAFAFMVITMVFASALSGSSFVMVAVGGILFVMVVFAIADNWFDVDRKKAMAVMVSICVIGALLAVVLMMILSNKDGYYRTRFLAFLMPYEFEGGAGYIYTLVSSNLKNAKFVGSVDSSQLPYDLVYANSYYIFAKTVLSYGVVAGIAIIFAFLCVIVRAFKIVKSQKNKFGKMMAFSCLITIACICVIGILINFNLFPATTIQFPFLSYGGSATLTYAVFIGLLMSCHRYEKIFITLL